MSAKVIPISRPEPPSWDEYERRKREFVATNPDATCAEYDRAIRKICKELGL